MNTSHYSDQDFIRLGFKQLDQWLNKADRELARFKDADWGESLDHAANLAWTIAHIEDWFYHHCQLPAANIPFPDYRKKVLAAFPGHAVFIDVCNALKHHDLERRKDASFQVETAINEIVEDPQLIFSTGPARPVDGSRQHKVLAGIGQDGQIIAYQTTSFGEFVVKDGQRRPFVDIAADALAFWRSSYEGTTGGGLPGWL